ncbi:unnamed protein product [Haemonchus placei]|uniref:Uncharacterized protein n=1 Tax=Haemonchus placei TaxID=6290 RepID=A0A0N4XAC4_HAEPC|nr:unnamed protein product [Haemonchus placei]
MEITFYCFKIPMLAHVGRRRLSEGRIRKHGVAEYVLSILKPLTSFTPA